MTIMTKTQTKNSIKEAINKINTNMKSYDLAIKILAIKLMAITRNEKILGRNLLALNNVIKKQKEKTKMPKKIDYWLEQISIILDKNDEQLTDLAEHMESIKENIYLTKEFKKWINKQKLNKKTILKGD